MRKLTLTNHVQSDTTVLENEFIDHYMAEANGEYVKVYLILLRHLNEPSGTLTISKIADLLDITEKDVIRALKYWKKQGILDFDILDTNGGPGSKDHSSDKVRPFPLNRRRILFPAQAARIPALCQITISLSSATERS